MFFSLIPREKRFHSMLDEAAVMVNRAAHKFLEMATKFDNLEDRAQDLKNEEEKCDAVVERIFRDLGVSFITPFDREDIHSLAHRLDDILDNLEETAHRIAVFHVAQATPATVKMARCIVDCCGYLEQAVHLTRDLSDNKKILNCLQEIGRLENEADRIYRNADADLFANGHGVLDVLMVVKMREIYSWLEETVDACKQAAHVISEIVIKSS
jgi:uncharacterized protein